jgi:cyclopropane fatty-acyl-phospholipid synthase-like methyltransferase
MMDNMMRPNALWLMESLTERLHLEPGMRVLDMG